MPRSESFAASQARVIINPHSERLNRHVVLRWAVCPGNHGREEREAKREVRVRWYSFISAGASSKSTRARTRAGTLRSPPVSRARTRLGRTTIRWSYHRPHWRRRVRHDSITSDLMAERLAPLTADHRAWISWRVRRRRRAGCVFGVLIRH